LIFLGCRSHVDRSQSLAFTEHTQRGDRSHLKVSEGGDAQTNAVAAHRKHNVFAVLFGLIDPLLQLFALTGFAMAFHRVGQHRRKLSEFLMPDFDSRSISDRFHAAILGRTCCGDLPTDQIHPSRRGSALDAEGLLQRRDHFAATSSTIHRSRERDVTEAGENLLVRGFAGKSTIGFVSVSNRPWHRVGLLGFQRSQAPLQERSGGFADDTLDATFELMGGLRRNIGFPKTLETVGKSIAELYELIRKIGLNFAIRDCTKQRRDRILSIYEASFPAAVVW